MKNMACFMICVVALLSFSGCSQECSHPSESHTSQIQNVAVQMAADKVDRENYYHAFSNMEHTFTVIEEQTDHYVIKSSNEHAGWVYEVYDNDGYLLDKGYHGYRGSFGLSKDGNIVVLEYGFSGTHVFPRYRFYDVENGRISKFYPGPVARRGELIALLGEKEDDSVALIVQNAFDNRLDYKELTAKFDDSIWLGLDTLSFSENGEKIVVWYYGKAEDGSIDYSGEVIEEVFP